MYMDLNTIAERCSRFSGWDLQWKIEGGRISFWDPKDSGKSRLSLCLMFPDSPILRETYGRMWHWAITREEQAVIARALGYKPAPTVPQMCDPFNLDNY
jgi:hypothetical protein